MTKHIIFGNFGNQTIALMQWAFISKIADVTVISIDTGWAAKAWQTQVTKAQEFAKQCGFKEVRLKSVSSFQDLMHDRKQFPSTKFQWCAGFLKGLALLNWLDDHDPYCEAVIMLGKRRQDSRANFDLPEFIEESKHYHDRKVWYPLYACDDMQFRRLISQAGFEILPHRSLECDPCVNSFGADLARLDDTDVAKTQALEHLLDKTLFEFPVEKMVALARKGPQTQSIDMFDMGCGSPYGCGE